MPHRNRPEFHFLAVLVPGRLFLPCFLCGAVHNRLRDGKRCTAVPQGVPKDTLKSLETDDKSTLVHPRDAQDNLGVGTLLQNHQTLMENHRNKL